MKRIQLIIFLASFFSGCIKSDQKSESVPQTKTVIENHTLETFFQIEYNNHIKRVNIFRYFNDLKDYIKINPSNSSLNVALTTFDKILDETATAYNNLTISMSTLLDRYEIDFELDSSSARLYQLRVLQDDVVDYDSILFKEGEIGLNYMEDMANKIAYLVFMPNPNAKYYEASFTRPEYFEDFSKFNYEGVPLENSFALSNFLRILLVPKYDDEDVSLSDRMFSNGCVVSTLEHLNILRGQVLDGCDKAIMQLIQ